jgi:hypothetical protein
LAPWLFEKLGTEFLGKRLSQINAMDSMIQDVLRPVGFDSNPSPETLQQKTGGYE